MSKEKNRPTRPKTSQYTVGAFAPRMRPVLGRRIISAPSISKNFPTSTAHSFVLSMSLPHGVLDSVFLKKENKKAKKIAHK